MAATAPDPKWFSAHTDKAAGGHAGPVLRVALYGDITHLSPTDTLVYATVMTVLGVLEKEP